MRKTRNSFFSEGSMAYQGYNPNMIGQIPPFQNPNNINSYYNNLQTNDLESRFARIERQINRLEHRIQKLENLDNYNHNDYDNNNTNMYMI